MQKHLELLGYKVKDVVTGFEGVVETVSFELYGCIQAVVRPKVSTEKPAEVPDGRWFDVKRLVKVGTEAVLPAPNFARPEIGGSDKPARPSSPAR